MGLDLSFGWLRKLGDFVFGYDFFISYAHEDGSDYPRQLSDQLQQSGYHVFLDERVYVAGDDLKAATKRRIRMSKSLVLVVRPKVLYSDWCVREVEESLAAGQTPIVIDVNGSYQGADADSALKRLLEDRIFLRETTENLDGEPSERVLGELMRSFKSMRVESRRIRFFASAALVLLVVSILAFWQYYVAQRNAYEYRRLCTDLVQRVQEGHQLIKGLEGESEFGKLIGTAAAELAKLPDFSTPEEECQLGRETELI